jgi:hypothetical protein
MVAPEVTLLAVDKERYRELVLHNARKLKTNTRLIAANLIIEAFNPDICEGSVIAIDSDILCIDRLKIKEDLPSDKLCVVPAVAPNGTRRGFFNSGFMIIGKDLRNSSIYEELLRHKVNKYVGKKMGGADQALLNDFFGKDQIFELGLEYNYTKRMVPDSVGLTPLQEKGIKLLHYVSEKPWERKVKDIGYSKVERLWHETFITNMIEIGMQNVAADFYTKALGGELQGVGLNINERLRYALKVLLGRI